MSRLIRLCFRDVPGIQADSVVTLSPDVNALLGRGAGSGRGVLLRWIAAVSCGDFSQTPAQPWSLTATLLTDRGEVEINLQRAEVDGPVLLLRGEGEDPTPLDPPSEDSRLDRVVYTPDLDLVAEVAPEGALRSLQWAPYALLATRARTPLDEEARVSLRAVPELSALWFHLDYDRGELVMGPVDPPPEGSRELPVGAVTFSLERDDGPVGAEVLTAAQRRLLNLHYYIACRQQAAFVEGGLELLDEDGLKDLLRQLTPPRGAPYAPKQSVFTADSSRLLYALDLRSAQAVQRVAVLCTRPAEDGPLVFRDMTDEEARKYYQFYEREFSQIDSLVKLW